jgi:hypothetical protein
VELHPIMMAQPPHELARGGVEAALVQPQEANYVARQRVQLPIRRWWDHPHRNRAVAGRRQQTTENQLLQRPPILR